VKIFSVYASSPETTDTQSIISIHSLKEINYCILIFAKYNITSLQMKSPLVKGSIKSRDGLGAVAHACNPSYVGGEGRRISVRG
jgi:hypothetical protein